MVQVYCKNTGESKRFPEGTSLLQMLQEFDVFVSMPAIETLGVNGASDAVISDFSGDYGITVTVNGAGDVELNNLALESLSFTVNGAADLVARELDVKKVNVAVNGAADACFKKNKILNAILVIILFSIVWSIIMNQFGAPTYYNFENFSEAQGFIEKMLDTMTLITSLLAAGIAGGIYYRIKTIKH